MSNNIDKIFYINLDKRQDRKIEIENELLSRELTNFERFQAIETVGFGILGCSRSHLEVLKIAKQRGYKNVLILEDDFLFLVEKEELEQKLTEFFNSEAANDYDVCMISYNLVDGKESKYPFMIKANEVQTASGYLVNAKFFDDLINLYEESTILLEQTGQHWVYANDQVWKKLQPQNNWYCFETRIGKQRSGFSDNANCYQSYDC
jgi:glycosyl transferase family 25